MPLAGIQFLHVTKEKGECIHEKRNNLAGGNMSPIRYATLGLLSLLTIVLLSFFVRKETTDHVESKSEQRAFKESKQGNAPHNEPLTIPENYKLSKMAKGGDVDAAYRLYEHYNFTQDDRKQAMVWLKLAQGSPAKANWRKMVCMDAGFDLSPTERYKLSWQAENGDVDSAIKLGCYYSFIHDDDKTRELYWEKKLPENGSD